MKRLIAVVALCVAVSPLAAQCPTVRPSPPAFINSTPQSPAQGAQTTLQAFSPIPDCPAPPPGEPSTCPPFPYQIGPCDTAEWSFGDGSTQTVVGSPFVTHTYANPGVYEIKLHISNSLGSADKVGSIYVTRIPATVVSVQRYNEANEADGSLTLHVTRSGDLSLANTVDWRLTDSAPSVIAPTPASGTIAFAPGDADHTLTFSIFRDYRYFGDAFAAVNLTLSPDGEVSNLDGFDVQRLYAEILVHDADPIPVGTIRDESVSKTSLSVRVPVDLSGAFAYPCCRGYFSWHSIDGTALDGIDYIGSQYGSQAVPSDTTSTDIEIPLKANPKPGTRTFDVELRYANFPLARSRATVTIVDDTPVIVANPVHMSVGAGAYASLSLSVDPPRSDDVVVNVTSSDPTVATVSSPVIIPAGGRATVLVQAVKPGHPTISITPAGGTPTLVDVQVVFTRHRSVNP